MLGILSFLYIANEKIDILPSVLFNFVIELMLWLLLCCCYWLLVSLLLLLLLFGCWCHCCCCCWLLVLLWLLLFRIQIARSAASLGAKATKVAIKYAPVDDTVKDLVSAGADIVSDQAEADPDASVADRLKIAAGELGTL